MNTGKVTASNQMVNCMQNKKTTVDTRMSNTGSLSTLSTTLEGARTLQSFLSRIFFNNNEKICIFLKLRFLV